jgi:hypothetical protein
MDVQHAARCEGANWIPPQDSIYIRDICLTITIWRVTVLYERALASLGFTCKEH